MVTASNRPVWWAFEAEVTIKKDGKPTKAKRWCVGHIDGQYHRTFQMEEVAQDFVKILNERDAALEKLKRAGAKVSATELKKGMKVKFLSPWPHQYVQLLSDGWTPPRVGQLCEVDEVYRTDKDGTKFWRLECSGPGNGYVVRAEDVEVID